uniref:Uncharacterized protein n=1 Tax=Plectus sambesii TaxID=2011161 RepID=A0A914WB78_9BILA
MMKIAVIAMMIAVTVAVPYQPLFKIRPRQTMSPPPCNLPPFTAKLPADIQLELRAIWSTYREGDKDCSSQLEDTKEILDNLPAQARLSLRPKSPPGAMCGVPPFIVRLTPENQQMIKSIWRDYKKGTDCIEQREATKVAFENLPESEKMALAQGPIVPQQKQ